jgi:hypothetical protein
MRPRHDQKQSDADRADAVRAAVSQGLAGISLMGIGAGLGAVLMSGPTMLSRGLGLVCEHHAGLAVVHCPGCYVALAMVAGGIAMAANALAAANQPVLRSAVAKFTPRTPRR